MATLSEQVETLTREYANIVAKSNDVSKRHTEIIAIQSSVASIKNALTNDIAQAKSLASEAQTALQNAKRIGIDIEGKGQSYVNYIERTLKDIELLGSNTTKDIDKKIENALNLLKEQTIEDASELTELAKNLKYELQQSANKLQTELSPFLAQLNDANAAIAALINQAKAERDQAEIIKGDVLQLKENIAADSKLALQNHEAILATSQGIKNQVVELCNQSITHLESANALIERFEQLKNEMGEADIENLLREILTNDKREILTQIIDSIVAQENVQNIVDSILSDGMTLLNDIKREGSKAVSSIATLKSEAENAHIKGLEAIQKESARGYTRINELYNTALTAITDARNQTLLQLQNFSTDVKNEILRNLQVFNRNVAECVEILLQSYNDFKLQIQNAKNDLQNLKDILSAELSTQTKTHKEELQRHFEVCVSEILKNQDSAVSEILHQRDNALGVLRKFFETLKTECLFLEQSLENSIESAKDTINIIVKGSFQKEITDTLNSSHWNNALVLTRLLDATFIKAEAHHRMDTSEQLLAQVKRDKAIVVDARGVVMNAIDDVRVMSVRLREFAAMSEWNSFMEVI